MIITAIGIYLMAGDTIYEIKVHIGVYDGT